ncbi:IclR family transcriptional regulator [Vibrio rumoiensis]|uniref:IclR family transcriptional regulator n=1 Tax=Vibrio rumoiensis TaxID=76258 RepID=UPI001E52F30F|nr:IclR family transcriptional regulator [Vibrio rumoiensis]
MNMKKTTVSKEKGSTIERVLRVMSYLSCHEGEFTTNELADKMDLPKLAMGKLVHQLKALGILNENLNRKIIAGPEFHQLSLEVIRNSVFSSQRINILEKLASEIGETCGISVPNGIDMLYLERVQTNWPLQVSLPVGSYVPMTATASGKLHLANLSQEVRQVILDNIALDVFTEHTIVDKLELEKELSIIAQLGYGRDNNEFIDGMAAVSVPISSSGLLFGYLFCHSPVIRHSLSDLEVFIPKMQEAADDIMSVMLNEEQSK